MVDDAERLLWKIENWDRTYGEILQLLERVPVGLEDRRRALLTQSYARLIIQGGKLTGPMEHAGISSGPLLELGYALNAGQFPTDSVWDEAIKQVGRLRAKTSAGVGQPVVAQSAPTEPIVTPRVAPAELELGALSGPDEKPKAGAGPAGANWTAWQTEPGCYFFRGNRSELAGKPLALLAEFLTQREGRFLGYAHLKGTVWADSLTGEEGIRSAVGALRTSLRAVCRELGLDTSDPLPFTRGAGWKLNMPRD
jgi:hypothetical protein